MTTLTGHPDYDIIFAGGGTAACLTAGRLAAADPSLKILILEAGKHTLNVPAHVQPARFITHVAPGSTTATFHISKSSEHLDGRELVIPSGKAVGGGSTINFMMYTRGAASDYDDWENVYGNPGWSFKDLEPLFQKTETYQAQENMPSHGYSGPLHVSWGKMDHIGDSFLKTAVKYDTTRKLADDGNNFHDVDVYAKWPKWIDRDTGRRSDTAHHFIYNQSHNKNLQVVDSVRVTKVIIKDGVAVGVEYVNEDVNLSQEVQQAYSSKLIVVSSGAFGSPAILERSGIGARSVLEKHGIECIVDLPGVGENYRDHTALFVPYTAAEDPTSAPMSAAEVLNEWETKGTGPLAHNTIDAAVKFRPSAEDLKEIGPSFTKRYQEYFANAPDKPILVMVPLSAFYTEEATASTPKYFTMVIFVTYPVATGSVHISSASDSRAPVEFDSAFLAEKADLALLRWGYKRSREFARRMDVYRGETDVTHPLFSSTEAAAGKDGNKPVPIEAADIVYTAEDDAAVETFAKKFVSTSYHSMSTCSMKPREQGGVVDSHLNVYGVRNLKVADLSIAPGNVSANTYSTAAVIGEKAAVIIAQELGIKL